MTARPPFAALLAAGLLPVVSGCSDSNSSSVPPPVVASAMIGPTGGAVVVDQGRQAGLVLTVPAGALDRTVEVRIIDETEEVLGIAPTSVSPQPGFPLRIEPVDVVLAANATLTVPFVPFQVSGTAPGNVRLLQQNPWTEREVDPSSVDVAAAEVAIETKTFGSFVVVAGPRAADGREYAPISGDVVDLGGGFEFVVEPVPSTSPFASQAGELWRLTGPGIDESLIVVEGHIVGRRADPETWRESWLEPFAPFQFPTPYGVNVTLAPLPIVAEFESPVGGLAVGSALQLWSLTQYVAPRQYDGRQVRDLVRLTIGIQYQHPLVTAGERWLQFYLSRDDGLIALSVDGVEFERIP